MPRRRALRQASGAIAQGRDPNRPVFRLEFSVEVTQDMIDDDLSAGDTIFAEYELNLATLRAWLDELERTPGPP